MDDALKKAIMFVAAPYSFGILQDAANLLLELKDNGIEPQEFIEYVRDEILKKRSMIVEYQKEKDLRAINYRMHAKRCKCGNFMALFRVNHEPRSMVGGTYNSMWACFDVLNCGESILSDRTVEQEYDAINGQLTKEKNQRYKEILMRGRPR